MLMLKTNADNVHEPVWRRDSRCFLLHYSCQLLREVLMAIVEQLAVPRKLGIHKIYGNGLTKVRKCKTCSVRVNLDAFLKSVLCSAASQAHVFFSPIVKLGINSLALSWVCKATPCASLYFVPLSFLPPSSWFCFVDTPTPLTLLPLLVTWFAFVSPFLSEFFLWLPFDFSFIYMNSYTNTSIFDDDGTMWNIKLQ